MPLAAIALLRISSLLAGILRCSRAKNKGRPATFFGATKLRQGYGSAPGALHRLDNPVVFANLPAVKRITKVEVLGDYRIRLAFDDGVEGIVDFSAKPRTGVYAPWQDYAFFRGARVGDAGELIWDDQLDFSANTLWLRITGRPPEALSPGFASPALHA